ncbi:acyl-CoA carboxylase subunit epsilon [Acidipropionibacterium virtanenii]|uniref:acyl-CoA carboxylase subunit epsilon n=1 Tax=Acidipropionibacterium virtanenii TaxID=2057246 RepID=UPI000DEC0708|nr:acyl-CoA carboxylase subunit epsilon [Acidipropionibacterium virtanenii]
MQIAGGRLTDEELGALVAVLAAVTGPGPDPYVPEDRPLAFGWKSYWRTIREPFLPGQAAWRGSLRRY